MLKPFEGILGNNCELRMIEFLLPLDEIYFNITELAEEVNISRVTATKVATKFAEWDILKIKKMGNVTYYSINRSSPIVESIQQLNNVLIEAIMPDEVLYEIHDYYWEEIESHKHISFEKEPILDSHGWGEDSEKHYCNQEWAMPTTSTLKASA